MDLIIIMLEFPAYALGSNIFFIFVIGDAAACVSVESVVNGTPILLDLSQNITLSLSKKRRPSSVKASSLQLDLTSPNSHRKNECKSHSKNTILR